MLCCGCPPFIEKGSKNCRHPKNVKIKYEGGGPFAGLLGHVPMFMGNISLWFCCVFPPTC